MHNMHGLRPSGPWLSGQRCNWLAGTALALLLTLPEAALAQGYFGLGAQTRYAAAPQSRARVIRVRAPRPPAPIKVKQVPLPLERPAVTGAPAVQAPVEDAAESAKAAVPQEPRAAPALPKTEPPAASPPPSVDSPAQAAAPVTAAPVDPLAALDPADRPIAEKVRDLLAAKTDKIFANKKERSAV